jgi:1-pyrroline-2-carboxylate reductase [NAD(P)H]
MKIIGTETVEKALGYPLLVDALQEAFSKPFNQPPRQVFLLDDQPDNYDAFALLPSWNEEIIAVKAFTYFPSNALPDPILHSKILIFSRKNGEPLALVDGTTVTFWRTAGVSGLATRLLSREDSSTMLMVGAGNLASYIISANASVRPLKKVLIWGNPNGSPRVEKANEVAEKMSKELPEIEFSVIEDLEAACAQSDIIVAATGSPDILIRGEWIKEGTHLDFIGNHHADKRECDTETITRSRVYVDSYVNAFKEAGEVLVPIEEGVFKKEDIVAELSEMCSGKSELRRDDKEITIFKSIGQAVTDLVAASVVYESAE